MGLNAMFQTKLIIMIKIPRFLLFSIFLLLFFNPVYSQQPNERLLLSTEVYFDFGEDELTLTSDSTLIAFLEALTVEPSLRIKITAHTDSIGSIKNNLALSKRRAENVKSFLVEKGFPDTLIRISHFGESKPTTSNQSEEGRQLNRRATVEALEKIPMAYLSGEVLNQESGKGIKADIVIHGKAYRDSFQTDSVGRFSRYVPDNTVIGIDVFAEGFFFDTRMTKVEGGKLPPLEIKLPKAKKGESVDIKNLYFVGNKAVLLEASEPTLPKVLKFMELNPGLTVEIAGHVNFPNRPPVGEDTWEYKLSVSRAKMVYDYLLENGINQERIRYKGYGNAQMKYPYATSEEQMKFNRRVEIRVLESGR